MLSQAVNWLLVAPLESVPERILPKAVELRKLLEAGELDVIELVFVHNALESKALSDELNVIADSFNLSYPSLKFKGVELGVNQIEGLFLAATTPIAVRGKVSLPVSDVLSTSSGDRWKAHVTIIPATPVFDLYKAHGDSLFSANVRDYLGTKKAAKKINNEMKNTAQTQGSDFFVFNNGITLLTHAATLEQSDEKKVLLLDGVSIINGAQTTGTLFEAGEIACESIQLQCRVLESGDPELLALAVKYNNTQNAVKASDRKSNDEVQLRLHREFDTRGVIYIARRSHSVASLSGYKIDADIVAQALCSFMGDVSVATFTRARIWDEKAVYDRVFPKQIPWNHVWFVHLLSKTLDRLVGDIKSRAKADTATVSQKAQSNLVSFSPSKQAIIYLFGGLSEQIMGRSVSHKYLICGKDSTVSGKREALEDSLYKILRAIVSKVANTKRDEEVTYRLVRTESLLARLVEDLVPHFEESFEDIDYIKTFRELVYVSNLASV